MKLDVYTIKLLKNATTCFSIVYKQKNRPL